MLNPLTIPGKAIGLQLRAAGWVLDKQLKTAGWAMDKALCALYPLQNRLISDLTELAPREEEEWDDILEVHATEEHERIRRAALFAYLLVFILVVAGVGEAAWMVTS